MTMVSRTGMSSQPSRTAYQNDSNPDPPAVRRYVSQRSYGFRPSATTVLHMVRLDNRRLLPVSGQPIHHRGTPWLCWKRRSALESPVSLHHTGNRAIQRFGPSSARPAPVQPSRDGLTDQSERPCRIAIQAPMWPQAGIRVYDPSVSANEVWDGRRSRISHPS